MDDTSVKQDRLQHGRLQHGQDLHLRLERVPVLLVNYGHTMSPRSDQSLFG